MVIIMQFITFPQKTIKLLESAGSARRKPPVICQVLIFLAVFITAQSFMSLPLMLMTSGDLAKLIVIVIRSADRINISNELLAAYLEVTMLPMLFLTVITTFSAILYCTTIEIRPLSSMGFVKKGWFSQYALGLGIGLLLFGGYIAISVLSGTLSYGGITTDGIWLSLILFFAGFVIQGMSEEVLCRGYLMISLCGRTSVFWAVLINSVLFSMFHLLNPGITILSLLNIALFGIFLSLYVLRTGNIWGASAIHTSWNFLQGNIFGCAVSGMKAKNSLFTFNLNNTDSLINGGGFGPEGGLAVTVVLSAACIVMLLMLKTKKTERISAKNEVIA